MSNEKFTQGEWGVFGNKNMPKHYIMLNPQKDVREQKIIANVFCCGGHGRANAYLIAAAPEMYECICDALSDLEMPDGMRNHFEAVLMKARGEE